MKPRTTSRRIIALVAVSALAVIGAIGWWLSRPDDTTVAGLPTRTVQAGPVEVIMTPLALDMASAARLRVNDNTIDGARWDGQGPGGHHREGALRFSPPIPPGASVELHITGLPVDARGSWTAP